MCVPSFNWKTPSRPWVRKDPNGSTGPRSPHARETRYNTARWRRIREIVLERWPLCSCCSDVGRVVPARVVDHITPVRDGGPFWDLSNLQSLCDSCHNAKSGDLFISVHRIKKARPLGGLFLWLILPFEVAAIAETQKSIAC